MASFKPEALRKRFKQLTDEYETRAGKRDAIMHERDKVYARLGEKERQAYDKRIIAANDGLYDIEMERAAIARALGGQTSEPANG